MGDLVDSVGTLLGGGANNSGFEAKGADILQPANIQQANQLYSQAQSGLTQQQQLVNALQAQNGIQNQSNLVGQLQGVANGTGPNPALAQLNQATGANVANQAALMAGQRGAGANAGMIARLAAQQGGALQQQAAGQGATMQAEQQLNAMNQLGNITGQQVTNQANAVGNMNQLAQAEQGQILNSIQGQNNAGVSMQSNLNSANAGMAQQNAANSQKAIGGLMNAAGAGIGYAFGGPAGAKLGSGITGGGGLAHGGVVGDENPKVEKVPEAQRFSGPIPDHMNHLAQIYHPHMAHGGRVPVVVSPGEVYVPPEMVGSVKAGANPLKEGEKIPGKAAVRGDSSKNDTVPAKLEPGGVVIPKSVMESEDPAGNAAKFIQALQEKKGSKESPEEFKEALKRAIATRGKKGN